MGRSSLSVRKRREGAVDIAGLDLDDRETSVTVTRDGDAVNMEKANIERRVRTTTATRKRRYAPLVPVPLLKGNRSTRDAVRCVRTPRLPAPDPKAL
ncbi:hypothetical protein [Haloterrigena salinisoli]|uniref:hypothetical protein n=1 Tax=Haloterrigena salinisoli TaxID=3132747 RepID=UPI0030D5FE65